MCLPLDDASMTCWLRTQIRVLEAWREELAVRPEVDIQAVTRLEQHYAWLTSEVARLDNETVQAA